MDDLELRARRRPDAVRRQRTQDVVLAYHVQVLVRHHQRVRRVRALHARHVRRLDLRTQSRVIYHEMAQSVCCCQTMKTQQNVAGEAGSRSVKLTSM